MTRCGWPPLPRVTALPGSTPRRFIDGVNRTLIFAPSSWGSGAAEKPGSPPRPSRVRACETGEMRDVTFGAKEAAACRHRIEAHRERLRDFCPHRGILY